jgi:hypothetical protein
MSDLLILAEAQIAEKQVKEIERIKARLEQDKEVLKEAIALVNSHTLYKKISDGNSGRYKYVLATEEMLKEDYLGEPKPYYKQGITFHYDPWKEKYNKGIMEVNGHTYYDIHYALNNYECMISEKEKELSNLNSKIRDIKDDLERLKINFPTLKQAVTEWMSYQQVESEE